MNLNMANPIIQRELMTLLRTRRAVALQVLLASVLALLVVLRWPTDARVDLDGYEARQVFSVFAYGLLVGLTLLAPVFPATTIVREKRQGTLALLLNSPLTPTQIVFGKLAGVLGFVLLLLVLSLPAAAACYAMGGLGIWAQLGKAYLVLACLAVQYSTLGLLVSSYAGTTEGAARTTYGLILLLAIVTLGPHQFMQGLLPPAALSMVDWIRCLSPIPAIMEVVGHEAVGSQGIRSLGSVAERYCLLAMVTSLIFVAWTWSRMHSRLFDQARSAGRITDERSASVQAYRRLMYLWFFDPQRRSSLIGPLTNPVMVKEFRTRRFGRGHWMMRMIGACLIISLALMLAAVNQTIDWGVETLGGILVLLQVALIVLLTPSLASGLIASEQESRGWQLLQMTPLSPLSIVIGKLMSVAWTLLLILLATLPAYAVLIYIKPEMTPTVISVLATMVLIAVFALLLSAAASSLFKRTAAATTLAYALLVGLCAGTMLVWLAKDNPFTRDTVETVLKANPLAAALQLIGTPGFAGYNLLPDNWIIIGGASLACLVVLVVQTWRLTRPR